jgi:peptide/nickel transport system substrate-binding protein
MTARAKLTIAVSTVALVTAACSASHHSTPSVTSGQAQVANAGAAGLQLDPNARGPAPGVPGAQRGGTVTVLDSGSFDTGFDPSSSYTTEGDAVLNLMVRTLTHYQRRGDKYVLVPDLATNLGTESKDGLTWTFHLKDGLRYEDGTPVTAADIAYSIKRSFAPELPDGPTYQKEFFVDGLTYQGPYKDGDTYAGVETPDAKTLVIHLRKKFQDMPYFASFPMFSPIPEAKDNKKDPLQYGLHPVATGPYKIKSFTPGKELVLTRNSAWDPATDPIRNQYPDTFDFKLSQNYLTTSQQMIEDRGSAQTSIRYGIDGPTYHSLMAAPGGPARLVTGPNPCTQFLYLDTRKIPDVRVRKAIGLAVPYTSAWKESGVIPGVTMIPNTTLLPPGTPGRINFDPLGNGATGNGDPAAAHKLLEKAGAIGFNIRWLYITDGPASVALAHIFKKQFEKAGFTFTLVPVVGDQFYQTNSDPSANINIRFNGWCSDWPSGSSWFPPLFYGPLIKQNPSSLPNPSFLNEPDVNAAIDRIEAMDDPAKAAVAWGQLDKLVMTKYYPAVIFGDSLSPIMRGSRVGGLHVDSTLGEPFYTDLYVHN